MADKLYIFKAVYMLNMKTVDEVSKELLVKGTIKKKKAGDIENVGKSLHYSTVEGAFNSASTSITNAYITPYAIALGANNAEIGLLSSVQNLTGTIAQIPGASLTQYMSRKSIWILSTVVSKILWIPIILIAFMPFNSVLLLIILLAIVNFFIALRSPAWTSLIGDIVPKDIRGKYFGRRNMIAGITGLAFMLISGQIVVLYGFSVIFMLSILLGFVSIFYFMKIREMQFKTIFHYKHALSFNPRNLIDAFRVNRNFVMFTLFISAASFAIYVAAPFYVVFMLKGLKISYTWYTLIIIFSAITTLVSQPYWGRFSDRYGERKVLVVTAVLMSFVPFSYLFVSSPWQILLIEGFSGFAFAGFDLVAFNFLIAITPAEKRPTYVANHTFFKGLSMVAGALLGGFLATHLEGSMFLWMAGLQIVFLISFIMRISSAALLAAVSEPVFREDSVPIKYLFWRAVAIEPVRGISHAIDFTFRYPQHIYDLKRRLATKLRKESASIMKVKVK